MERQHTGVSVVVPVHNEQDVILATINAIHQRLRPTGREYEILVVDDGSTDGTAKQLEGVRLEGGQLEGERLEGSGDCVVLRHETNRGYGASLKTGIQRARFPLVAILDADGTYPIRSLPRLIRRAEHADMVVGRRHAERFGQLWVRRSVKWLLTCLAVALVGKRIEDLNSGMRVFRRRLAHHYWDLYPNGFSFTTTITLAMLFDQRRVEWTPIRYQRRVGRSKIRPVRDTGNLLRAIFRTTLHFAPARIVVPVATSCSLLLGIGLFWHSIEVPQTGDRVLLMLANLIQLGMVLLMSELAQRRATGRTQV